MIKSSNEIRDAMNIVDKRGSVVNIETYKKSAPEYSKGHDDYYYAMLNSIDNQKIENKADNREGLFQIETESLKQSDKGFNSVY